MKVLYFLPLLGYSLVSCWCMWKGLYALGFYLFISCMVQAVIEEKRFP